MFLKLKRTNLDVYVHSRQLALECYKVTKHFPADEKFGMISQIRRAALSVHLNIAEGCSRKSSVERCRYFEISRGSIIEIDAALDIASELRYTNEKELEKLGHLIINTFKMLSGLLPNSSTHN